MATTSTTEKIITTGIVELSDLKAIIEFYNSFSINYTLPEEGSIITAEDFNNFRETIISSAENKDYSIPNPPDKVSIGDIITSITWNRAKYVAPPPPSYYAFSSPGTYQFTIPSGYTGKFNVSSIGGGGGGGSATLDYGATYEYGSGGTSGGTGSGSGNAQPGDTLTVLVGAGGGAGQDGGYSSVIYQNQYIGGANGGYSGHDNIATLPPDQTTISPPAGGVSNNWQNGGNLNYGSFENISTTSAGAGGNGGFIDSSLPSDKGLTSRSGGPGNSGQVVIELFPTSS